MLGKVYRIWDEIWFAPKSSLPMAIYRILYGLLLIWSLALLWPNLSTFFGSNGILSISTANQYLQPGAFDLLNYLPAGDQWMTCAFVVTLVAAVMLTLGMFTRISALVVLLGLISFHNRNPLILNSGDTLLSLGAYFLFLSNAGDACSIDCIIRSRFGKSGSEPAPPKSPWAQRLLQFQILLVYIVAFWSKTAGDLWLNGTAVYYVLHVDELVRIPIPFIASNLLLCKMLTWSTLLIEASIFTLIWFRRLRYYVLAAIALVHVGIEITLNIPIFEWLMIASLVVFVYPEDLERLIGFAKNRLRPLARHSQDLQS